MEGVRGCTGLNAYVRTISIVAEQLNSQGLKFLLLYKSDVSQIPFFFHPISLFVQSKSNSNSNNSIHFLISFYGFQFFRLFFYGSRFSIILVVIKIHFLPEK